MQVFHGGAKDAVSEHRQATFSGVSKGGALRSCAQANLNRAADEVSGDIVTKAARRSPSTRWIYNTPCISKFMGHRMQVSKWGNSLAVRLPASVVEALELKAGDDIEIRVAGAGTFEVGRKPGARELLARLRKFRGRLPADFHFERLEAHERG